MMMLRRLRRSAYDWRLGGLVGGLLCHIVRREGKQPRRQTGHCSAERGLLFDTVRAAARRRARLNDRTLYVLALLMQPLTHAHVAAIGSAPCDFASPCVDLMKAKL